MPIGETISSGDLADIIWWDDDCILKLYREDRPEAANWEAMCVQAAHEAGIPVPRLLDVLEIDDRLGVLLERIEGETMLQSMIEDPGQIVSFARQFAELHVDMHSRPAPRLVPQHRRVENQIRQTTLHVKEMKAELLAQLAELPAGSVICHGDFHPGNVILSPDGPVIIDWLDATAGSPVADVARTILVTQPEPLPAVMPRTFRRFMAGAFRFFCMIYLQRYQELRPISLVELSAWELPTVTARLAEFDPDEAFSLSDTLPLALPA